MTKQMDILTKNNRMVGKVCQWIATLRPELRNGQTPIAGVGDAFHDVLRHCSTVKGP